MKTTKKLGLKKQTIANLMNTDMSAINGGGNRANEISTAFVSCAVPCNTTRITEIN
ncbi:MAG: hypothetical protein GY757_46675 [bacterium]|nr:hypothetical protein [bacterium]